MSPQAVVGRQEGSSPVVVANVITGVVEVVCRFDHALRISKHAPLGRRDASAGAGAPGQVTYDDRVLAPAEGDDWLD